MQLSSMWKYIQPAAILLSIVFGVILLAVASMSKPAVAQDSLWGRSAPIIIALDGIIPFWKQLTPEIVQARMEPPYLAQFLADAWGYRRIRDHPPLYERCDNGSCSELHAIPWGGLLTSPQHITQFIDLTRSSLRSLANRYPGRPIVVIGHSWGSVVAYQALTELHEGQNVGSETVIVLVTLGSPLTTRQPSIQLGLRALRALRGETPLIDLALSSNAPKPHVVRNWVNYHNNCDIVSTVIGGADYNVNYWPREFNNPCPSWT